MVDHVTSEKRSEIMASIRGKNTLPELLFRKALHNEGYRYRLHVKKLPGKPDLVLSKYKTAVFIHGCFWHGHFCKLTKLPKSNVEFWNDKISCNIERDRRNFYALQENGWKVITVWECALKGKRKLPMKTILKKIKKWFSSNLNALEIQGVQLAPTNK